LIKLDTVLDASNTDPLVYVLLDLNGKKTPNDDLEERNQGEEKLPHTMRKKTPCEKNSHTIVEEKEVLGN